jgi:Domain of unknown function (DUF927)
VGAVTAADSPAAATFLRAMDAAGKRYQQTGPGQWRAQCPAHDDHDPSLTVDWQPSDGPGRQSRIVMDCKAGCDRDSLPAALGLTWRDLYDGKSELGRSPDGARAHPSPASRPPVPAPRKRTLGPGHDHSGQVEAQHVYADAQGTIAGRVDRIRCADAACPDIAVKGKPGHAFVTRTPDGRAVKGATGPLADLLYRLPEVLAAVAAGRPVWLCEGEGDADAVSASGECGTSPFGGSKRKIRPAYLAALAGADVTVCADRDRGGYQRAAEWAELLDGVARSVRVRMPVIERPGADVSDHLAAGLGLADMLPCDPAAELAALPPVQDRKTRVGDTGPGSNGQAPPPPESGPDPAAGDDEGAEADRPPRYRLPSSSGAWGYSTGADGPGYADRRGVYRQVTIGEERVWLWVEEMPYVFARIVHRDGANRPSRRSYRLGTRLDAGPDELALAGHMAVKTGEWSEALGVPLAADPKVIQAVASAIYREAERSAPRIEAAPRWTPDGVLEMPPEDCGPAGYGLLAGSEDAARATWARAAEILARHGRAALAAGAGVAGPYMAPLRRQSFIVHLAGRDRRGKTTAHVVSAGIYGDPDVIVRPWDASAIGLSQLAGEYGCLPPILDELGARRGPKSELQAIVFQFAQGARRTKGGREGQSRIGAPWHGVVLSTGNVSLLANLTERGAIARTVEIPTPIIGTDDAVDDPAAAADAEALESLAAEAHGWPFAWIRAAGITPEVFGALLAAAETDLDIAGGGTLRTIGRHLAAAVAGAAVLGQVLGHPGLRDAALSAAAGLLADMADRLDELSAPPAERLAAAVALAVISRPEAFPALGELRDPDGGRRFRDGEGFRITAPAADPETMTPAARARWAPPPGTAFGDVGVFPSALAKIGTDGGLEDAMTALRGLRDSGALVTSGESDGRLRRQVRVNGLKADAYVFRLATDDDPGDESAGQDAETGPGGGDPLAHAHTRPMSDRPGTPGTDQLATLPPAETDAQSVPGGPGTDQLTGDTFPPAQTQSAETGPADVSAGGGAVPGAVPGADPDRGQIERSDAGAVMLIDADSLYLGDGIVVADAPRRLAEVLELAAGLGLGSARLHPSGRDADGHLYLTRAACKRYRIPVEPPDIRTLALAEDHPAAVALREAGWTLTAIRPSTQVYRRGDGAASLSVSLLSWLPHAAPGLEALTADHPSPASLARRLAAIADTAYPLRWTAGVTSNALMMALRPRTRLRDDPETGERRRVPVKGSLPGPVPPSLYDAHVNHPAARGRADADECREESLIWTRPREHWTADELAAPYAVAIDVNTMFLAAAASLPVGLSAPRPLTGAELADLNAACAAGNRKAIRPGVYVAEVSGLEADPRLPSPLTDTGEWPPGPLPLHAPTLRYAIERGATVRVSAGSVSDVTGPYLDPWNRRLVAAYLAALAGAGITPDMPVAEYLAEWAELADRAPDAAAVVSVIKALAKAGIGRMRQDPDGTSAADRDTWRPDIRAEVISRARTDLHRKIMRTFDLIGVAPLAVAHDAVLYASDDPSPVSVVPVTYPDGAAIPGAFRLGCRPGWAKHSHTLPLAEALAQLDAGLNPAARHAEGMNGDA